MNYTNVNSEISVADIKEVEKNKSIIFPGEYKSFLLQQNGGKPAYQRFINNDKEVVIGAFYSVKFGKTTVEKAIDNTVFNEEYDFPEKMFPIASTLGGDTICISTRAETNGQIFVYEHHYYLEGEEEALVFLSNSLNDFIDSLVE
jgi:hypothetical protein